MSYQKWDSAFEPYWPLQDHLDRGIYFYNQAIDEYEQNSVVNVVNKGRMLMFGSYSYLGLNKHRRINEAAANALRKFGTGTHGVRLLSGTLEIHRQLEDVIRRFKQTDAAITFSNGYIANVSTIAAITGPDDAIYCDKYNHASIIDGCRLSNARFYRFRHNDLGHLESLLKNNNAKGNRLVIADAVFSMDGDIINLPAVVNLCEKYSAILMIDEAHSVGVLGSSGKGIAEHFGLSPESIQIYMGSMGKAIPSIGGYIASTRKMCDFLAHSSRGYIYSASLPPPAVAAATEAFHIIEEEPQHHDNLQGNISYLKKMFQLNNIPCTNVDSAIFPVICGEDETAWNVANFCQSHGVYVQAIPHPVVPKGQARLRAAVTAAHTKEELEKCVSVITEAYTQFVYPLQAESRTQ